MGGAELEGVAPRGESNPRGLDPLRPLLRDALLVDRLALGAVRVPLELGRPLVERADDAVSDGQVMAHEVELRLAPLPEEDLVRVRDLDGPAAHLELDEGRGHG